MPGIINVSFVFGFLVRSDKDTKKWIPHLTITSAAGPGTQLQLTCRLPPSRTVQTDRWGDGPALPWLPGLQPELSGSRPRTHSPLVPESRKRAPPSKVAKAAFLWTTQEMYVRKLFLILFIYGPLIGFLKRHWVCRLRILKFKLVLEMDQTSSLSGRHFVIDTQYFWINWKDFYLLFCSCSFSTSYILVTGSSVIFVLRRKVRSLPIVKEIRVASSGVVGPSF